MNSAEQWMVRAAAEAAPPLSVDMIDRLRRILAAPHRNPVHATVTHMRLEAGRRREAA